MLAFMRPSHMWQSYNRALQTRPLRTKIFTGIAGTVIGDGVAQYASFKLAPKASADKLKLNQCFSYDYQRLIRLIAWSAAVGTPVAHFWFQFLDKNILPSNPKSLLAIGSKLLLDQAIMAPAGTASFFAGMKVMEGRPGDVVPALQTKLWPVLLANWSVWPLANLVNFAFVPPQQRILYINILSVAWVAFMSHMAAAHPVDTDAGREHSNSRVPHPRLIAGERELGSDPDGLMVFEAPVAQRKKP